MLKLDDEISDGTSSSSSPDDDDDDSDNDMPHLSPVSDVSVSSFIYPSSSAVASTSATSSSGCVSLSSSVTTTKSSIHAVGRTQLYCICRTPYDKTK